MGFLPTLHIPSSSPSRPVPRAPRPLSSHPSAGFLPIGGYDVAVSAKKKIPSKGAEATLLLGTVARRTAASRKRGTEKGAVEALRRGLPLYSTGPTPRRKQLPVALGQQ